MRWQGKAQKHLQSQCEPRREGQKMRITKHNKNGEEVTFGAIFIVYWFSQSWIVALTYCSRECSSHALLTQKGNNSTSFPSR
jgi:hypothetical protein